MRKEKRSDVDSLTALILKGYTSEPLKVIRVGSLHAVKELFDNYQLPDEDIEPVFLAVIIERLK